MQATKINQIILSFSDLFKAKKISIIQIQPIIHNLYNISNQIPFHQRISILNTIVYFLHQALINHQSTVEKFKYEVFYGAFKSQSETKIKKEHTTRKNQNRNGQKKKVEITINQILQQAVSDGLAQLENLVVPQTTIKQDSQGKNNLVVLPPFEAQVIAELAQDINLEVKTPVKEAEMLEWEPSKLQNYKKWLALTQNGVTITQQPPKPPKTKKKNAHKDQLMIDHKIEISQGTSQMKVIQELATKIKTSRKLLQNYSQSFQYRIQSINPLLTHLNQASTLQQLKIQYSKVQKKQIKEPSLQSQPYHNEPELNLYSINSKKSQSSQNSAKQAQIRNIQQTKLTNSIKQALFMTKRVTFRSICKSDSLKGMSKGQIFYQLLHLNFKLQQRQVSSFGQIFISGGQ